MYHDDISALFARETDDGVVTVDDLIAARMQRTPEAIAIVVGERRYSYAELDRASAMIAAAVAARLDGAVEALVGVCVERSFDLVAALLGVLRAGAAYLPLDPDLPTARITDIVADARPDLILSGVSAPATITASGVAVIGIDEMRVQRTPPMPRALPVPPSRDRLAYVIYTSGSTGRPKGVEVRQAAVLNLLRSMAEEPGIDARDVLVAATRTSFDISVLELFLPLVVGARIVLADTPTAADPRKLAALLDKSGATIFQATPTTWRGLLATGWAGAQDLRILSGGEPMSPALAKQLLPRCRELWNLYGPTETTVWSTAHCIRSASGGTVPIGEPIARTTLQILDAELQPVADGESGELCIGGAGLARGYRHRPELTAERFPTLPDGLRVYRTGDLARRESDGTLSCLGRIDDQVKIRGHRVELGEVEAALGSHADVAIAAARCLPDRIGENALVGYVVANADRPFDAAALAGFLRDRLPVYMVPAQIVAIDAMPLTPSGKIDRKALPDSVFVPPTTNLDAGFTPGERMLAVIWTDLLGVGVVSRDDDFFDLGGYSLLTAHLLRRIEQDFGRCLSLADLFLASTLGGMARLIEGHDAAGEWRPLLLRAGGARLPLYWLDGGPLLRVVAREMSHERPVLGANLTLAEEAELRRSGLSIEAVAATLARRLDAVQPDGPLHIGGWCRWGIVAYEAARQLSAQGREVRCLLLLDADHPVHGWRRLRWLGARVLRRLGLKGDVDVPAGGNSFSEEVELAAGRYRARRYDGPVALMRPDAVAAATPADGGWRRSAKRLRIFSTPGDHLTMIRPPYAAALAKAIDEALE